MSDIEEYDIDYDIDTDYIDDDYLNNEQIDDLITSELNINKSKKLQQSGGSKKTKKKVTIKEDSDTEEKEEKEEEKEENENENENDNDDEDEYEDENENSTDLNELENDDDDIEIINNSLISSSMENIVHPQNRILSEYLSRYEYSKVIGIRAEQLTQGAIPYVDVKNMNDPIEMAKKELNENKCPLSIKRYIGLNKYEIWSVNEVIKKNYS
jgi:DNA-directed RNA polymerases I, II, and III subunit RPABC2